METKTSRSPAHGTTKITVLRLTAEEVETACEQWVASWPSTWERPCTTDTTENKRRWRSLRPTFKAYLLAHSVERRVPGHDVSGIRVVVSQAAVRQITNRLIQLESQRSTLDHARTKAEALSRHLARSGARKGLLHVQAGLVELISKLEAMNAPTFAPVQLTALDMVLADD